MQLKTLQSLTAAIALMASPLAVADPATNPVPGAKVAPDANPSPDANAVPDANTVPDANAGPDVRAPADAAPAPVAPPAQNRIPIPANLRDRGLVLRIDDEDFPLTGSEVRVGSFAGHRHVELVDGSGRLLAEDRLYINEALLDYLRPRTWRIGLWFGNAVVNGSTIRPLLQDSLLDEQALDVDWQPSALGLRFELNMQSSIEEHAHIESDFQMTALDVAATYEIAAGSTLHLVAFAGGRISAEQVVLHDAGDEQSFGHTGYGEVGGLDLQYPVSGGLWLGLRGELASFQVAFPGLDFTERVVERNLLFGVNYAF